MSRKTRKAEAQKVRKWEVQKDPKRHRDTIKRSYISNFHERMRKSE